MEFFQTCNDDSSSDLPSTKGIAMRLWQGESDLATLGVSFEPFFHAFLPVPLQVFKVSGSASLIVSKTKLQIMVEGDEEALAYLSLE